MIISASRRTDIPAFYSRWLINRLRAGFCRVPNPFNPLQVAVISLTPEDVDAIVFWTRSPRPLFPYLQELGARGYRYYFQFTLLDYPRLIDHNNPPAERSLAAFKELANRIGPQRVVWRYDPIVLSEVTPVDFHLQTYARLARSLRGCTQRSVISFLDIYPKLRSRLSAMAAHGAPLLIGEAPGTAARADLSAEQVMLAGSLEQIARQNGMEVFSCAEAADLRSLGVEHGKCIDDGLIGRIFGLEVTHLKDPGQREACGCVQSRDIGMYDSCLFGCQYCYATRSFDLAREHYRRHDPDSPALLSDLAVSPLQDPARP